MKITPVDAPDVDLLKSDLVRSPGVHMSEIYSSLYAELEPKRYGSGEPPNPLLLAMGTAWELHFERLLMASAPPGVSISRPAEFMNEDGIAFSPDLLISNGDLRVGEMKLTFQSSAEDISAPKFSKWIVQMQAYCHGMETPHARLYVLFVNGDYKTQRWPQLKIWDFTFTARELHDNYQMLLNHAKRRGLL